MSVDDRSISKAEKTRTQTSLLESLSPRWGVPASTIVPTLRDTVFKTAKGEKPFDNNELKAALIIAQKYDLNPFVRELFLTRSRGSILVIVPIDGWAKIANRDPDYDGQEFAYNFDGKELISVTCRIFHRSRSRPTEVTEFLDECRRPTEPWKKWPKRMLRHKAFVQACRLAFGVSDAVDSDEASRIKEASPELVEFVDVGDNKDDSIGVEMSCVPDPVEVDQQQSSEVDRVANEIIVEQRSRDLVMEWNELSRGTRLSDDVHEKCLLIAGVEKIDEHATIDQLEAALGFARDNMTADGGNK